jgi:PAS domain S-box-containing protein
VPRKIKVEGKLRAATPNANGKKNRRIAEQREFLAAIVDSSDDAIISKTLDGTITSWNRGAERIYGYEASEIVGRNITALVPPEKREEIAQILNKVRRGERIDHYESVRITKDHRRLNVSVTISPIRDGSGKIVGASAIGRDITGIEQARQSLRESESTTLALFQSAAQAIVIVNARGTIVMANPATQTVFGYSPEELIGKPIEILVPESLRAGHHAHRDRYFSSPQKRPMGLGMELKAVRKDGLEFYVEISLSYIQSSQGTLGVALVTDITKRRADEDAIRQQRADLRTLASRLMTAQDDERRRIARDLHDDLSQKLAFLAMDMGKLATRPSAEQFIAELRPLQLRAADAAMSVRRISHELHPSVLDDIGLEAALEQYCDEFESRTGITTRFTSRNVPDPVANEIASSLYHIAQECLRNTAKHSHSKSVAVELDFNDGVLHLTVRDRGVGLTPDQSKTDRGIGMVAMKERAHLVNGTLSIQSAKGAGTEVRVEVPLGAE